MLKLLMDQTNTELDFYSDMKQAGIYRRGLVYAIILLVNHRNAIKNYSGGSVFYQQINC